MKIGLEGICLVVAQGYMPNGSQASVSLCILEMGEHVTTSQPKIPMQK